MWNVKLKLINTDNSMVVTRGEGSQGAVKGKGGQMYGDGGWFDFGWWAYNAMYRSCMMVVYTWNLSKLINQCNPSNRINKIKTN